MTYGAEIVIPLEMRFPMLRTSLFTPNSNDNLLERSLDLIEERREKKLGNIVHDGLVIYKLTS